MPLAQTLSDRHLRRWYRELNARYFDGRLSEEIDILYAPHPEADCCADVGPDRLEDYIIRVNPAYQIDNRIARIYLLHEMAHISVWPYAWHGSVFQAEMQRLAAAGAFKGLW